MLLIKVSHVTYNRLLRHHHYECIRWYRLGHYISVCGCHHHHTALELEVWVQFQHHICTNIFRILITR